MRKLKFLITYGFLLWLASGLAQSFQGNLKIENITFPEGSQLAYVYDIAQDSTGLIWMGAGLDFYTYNGHKLSKAELQGFSLSGAGGQLRAYNASPYFFISRDSVIVYDPAAKKLVQILDYHRENATLWPDSARLSYTAMGKDGVLWAISHLAHSNKALVVRSSNKGPFHRLLNNGRDAMRLLLALYRRDWARQSPLTKAMP